MAALVQAFPTQQSAASVSLLQTRPQSASGTLQSNSQIQSHAIMQQRSMSSYGPSSGNSNSGYRSFSGTAPVAPYAFTSTPGLTNSHSKQQTQAWSDNKNPAVRQLGPEETRLRYPVSDTSSSSSSVSSDPPSRYHQSHQQQQATAFTVRANPNTTARPVSVASPPVLPAATKSRPSPDRYRRKKSDGNMSSGPTVHSPAGSALPSGSGMAAVGAHYTSVVTPGRTNSPVTTSAGGVMNPIESYAGQLRSQSVDDIHTHRPPNGLTPQQRQQRRASVGAFSPGSLSMINGNNSQAADLSNLQLPSFAPQGANQRLHGSKGSAPNMVARRGSNDSSQSSSSHSYRPNSVRFSFACLLSTRQSTFCQVPSLMF